MEVVMANGRIFGIDVYTVRHDYTHRSANPRLVLEPKIENQLPYIQIDRGIELREGEYYKGLFCIGNKIISEISFSIKKTQTK